MGQLNIKVVATENEEQYTLTKVLYIVFQTFYSFFWSFLEAGVKRLKGRQFN